MNVARLFSHAALPAILVIVPCAAVADTAENRAWFLQLKDRLKRDFDQLDIWMITHPIEVL